MRMTAVPAAACIGARAIWATDECAHGAAGLTAGPDEAYLRRASMYSSATQKGGAPPEWPSVAERDAPKQALRPQAPPYLQHIVWLCVSSMQVRAAAQAACSAWHLQDIWKCALWLHTRTRQHCFGTVPPAAKRSWPCFLDFAVAALLQRSPWSWAACDGRAAGWAEGAAFPELRLEGRRSCQGHGRWQLLWVQSS